MIHISGTIIEIRNKLLAISAVVKHRKYLGWPPFQPDEEWLYESEQDDRVCPTCQAYESQQYFAGDAIPYEFEAREQIDPIHYVHPHVHMNRPELRGECRCGLMWINPVETLRIRLADEMMEVSG